MSAWKPVLDSSLWQLPSTLGATHFIDSALRMGIVKKAVADTKSGELRYLVDVINRNDSVPMNCRMLRRWGGVYNYEDSVFQGYTFSGPTDKVRNFDAKAGDLVLVANIAGRGFEGVILGGLTHAARTKVKLDPTDGPQHRSEFNGIETFINKDGEYTLTFKGLPTNLSGLKDEPGATIPAAEYDMKVGSSFFKMDKTGSLMLNDNAQQDPQFINIDKPNGIIDIVAGKVLLKMTKSDQSVLLTCKTTELDATDSITMKTKSYEVNANDHVKYTTQKTTVVSTIVYLGAEQLITSGAATDGVVTGVGIDPFTGQTYTALGNTSSVVFAKK